MTTGTPPRNSLYGPLADVAADAGYADSHPARVGFFTDTSVCIGCKACEVACKEWNGLPEPDFDVLRLTGMSYDNTGALGSNSWRHVAFVEQDVIREITDGPATRWLMASDVCKHCTHAACLDVCPTGALVRTEFGTVIVQPDVCNGCAYCVSACPFGVIDRRDGDGRAWKCTMCYDRLRGGLEPACATACPTDSIQFGPLAELPTGPSVTGEHERTEFRWLMSSDVCKHCTHAGCLDVCPTGALVRTEFGTVIVQPDVCNGCAYCVSACPFGVIDRREDDGRAWKCTMCYDRLRGGLEPACAKACPTQSIQFGPLDELRERAAQRLDQLHSAGVPEARLYGADPGNGVGGDGAFFLLLDEPEVYGLPPDPVVPTRDLISTWKYTGLAASALVAAAVSAFVGRGGR